MAAIQTIWHIPQPPSTHTRFTKLNHNINFHSYKISNETAGNIMTHRKLTTNPRRLNNTNHIGPHQDVC